jgi:hypothetical protein
MPTKEVPMKRLFLPISLVVALAVIGLLCGRSNAAPAPAPRHEADAVLQRATVVAKTTMQTWESKALAGRVFVHLTVSGKPLVQHDATGCSAVYSNHQVVAKVTLVHCGARGANPIRVQIAAFSGFHSVAIRLGRS